MEVTLSAPTSLSAHSRGQFREEALAALDSLGGEGGGRLVVDLSATGRVDSAGLGTLVMIQLRAAERRISVVLRAPSEEIRFLLLMTRLEERFIIEPAGPA